MIASAKEGDVTSELSRTELDSHANMVVIGSNCTVFDHTGKFCTVNSFSESAGKLERVPVVDAVVAYDCPYSAKVYLLLMRNALQVSDIQVNLLPPFIVRETGLHIDDCPKSQSADPTIDTHCIYSREADLRIHFGLHNTFSYFETRRPTEAELATCDKIFLTPDSAWWNPHSYHFTANEEAMLMPDGSIPLVHERSPILLEDRDYSDPPSVDVVEAHIDLLLASAINSEEIISDLSDRSIPIPENSSVAFMEMQAFYDSLASDALRGKISAAFGLHMSAHTDDDERNCPLFTTKLDELESEFESEIAAVDVTSPKGVTPEFISKIWSVSQREAEDIVEQNTQLNRQSADGLLSRQFSTNDRMLRYRRIQSYFFTDTMFVTKQAESTRGNTCLQLFVSDKGYVAVYPMESKSDFDQALHLFCKEVGVPVTLVVDPSGE